MPHTGRADLTGTHKHSLEAAKVALVEAAKFGHRELVGALIDEGEGLLRAGDDSIADDRGRTPLMYAALCAQNSKHAACPLADALIKPRHDEVAELLVRAGALLDATDNDDRTALMFAAMSEHTEVLSLLLNAGAKHFDGEADDGSVNHGWSPLHYAVMHNSLGTVQLLLEANANANAADAQVRTDAARPKRALAPTALQKIHTQ